MRDGVIEDVGAAVTAPADALVVDGTGLTVYPGSDRHGQHRGGRSPDQRAGGRGGRRRLAAAAAAPPSRRPTPSPGPIRSARPAPATSTPTSTRPRWSSSTATTCGGSPPPASPRCSRSRRRASSAGQSALVNVTAPPDPAETSALATYRRGLVVVQVAGRAARRLCDRRAAAAVAAADIPARCSA